MGLGWRKGGAWVDDEYNSVARGVRGAVLAQELHIVQVVVVLIEDRNNLHSAQPAAEGTRSKQGRNAAPAPLAESRKLTLQCAQ